MKLSYFCLLSILNLSLFLNVKCQLQSASLIGGKKTHRNEIKYLVSLQSDEQHICGGSIIADKYILTAAHCLINDEDNKFTDPPLKVIAGTNNLRVKNSQSIEVEVKKIYMLKNYNNSEWIDDVALYDIAVLKLKKSLDLKNNSNLKRLHLPRGYKNSKSYYQSYRGKEVLIAGFGWDKVKVRRAKNKTKYEVGSSTDRLFSATAEVISNTECQQYYRTTLKRNQLCAKMNQHDDDTPQGVCRGDSGGPLVYKSRTIIGVLSAMSIGCNENKHPGIYTRVSFFIHFIRNAMNGDVTDNMLVKHF